MESSGNGSGNGPNKGWGSSFRRLFGGGQKKTTTVETATATETSQTTRRRSTITDASTVADAFRSGNPNAIQDIMKKHEVRTNLGGDAKSGSYTFGVTDFGVSRDRRDSQGQLREMKTFLINSSPSHDTPQFKASYSPMAVRQDGWSGGSGTETLNMGNVDMSSQQDSLEFTPRLPGCSVIEDFSGQTGHVQPFNPRTDVPETSAQASLRSANRLKSHRDITAVFGPQEYGRHNRADHVGSNAVVFKNHETGNKTILHQAIYRDAKHVSTISVSHQPFGRRYRMGPLPAPEHGPMTRPVATPAPTATTSTSTLQAPSNPMVGSRREPRPG